jgi:hypothetical protein
MNAFFSNLLFTRTHIDVADAVCPDQADRGMCKLDVAVLLVYGTLRRTSEHEKRTAWVRTLSASYNPLTPSISLRSSLCGLVIIVILAEQQSVIGTGRPQAAHDGQAEGMGDGGGRWFCFPLGSSEITRRSSPLHRFGDN